MKHRLVVAAFFALSCSVAHSQSGTSQTRNEAEQSKVKVKDGKSIERDKSKPVRKGDLETYCSGLEDVHGGQHSGQQYSYR